MLPSSASAGRLTSRPGHPHLPPHGAGVHPLDAVGLPDTLLAVPPRLAPGTPLLVFFHGAGGHAAGTWPLVREEATARGALVLLPSSAGTTWDLLAGGLGRDLAALDAALAHVHARYAVGPTALAGFSDGASYALSLGIANGDVASAVLAFSPGFLAAPDVVGRPRVWMTHGRSDTVLPFERCGRRVAQQLGQAGYDVQFEEFPGGHVVLPQHVWQAFTWWLGPEAA